MLCILDESNQYQTPDKMFSAMRTSLGKFSISKLLAISTRPALSSHPFAKMLSGGGDVSVDYRASHNDNPFIK